MQNGFSYASTILYKLFQEPIIDHMIKSQIC